MAEGAVAGGPGITASFYIIMVLVVAFALVDKLMMPTIFWYVGTAPRQFRTEAEVQDWIDTSEEEYPEVPSPHQQQQHHERSPDNYQPPPPPMQPQWPAHQLQQHHYDIRPGAESRASGSSQEFEMEPMKSPLLTNHRRRISTGERRM